MLGPRIKDDPEEPVSRPETIGTGAVTGGAVTAAGVGVGGIIGPHVIRPHKA